MKKGTLCLLADFDSENYIRSIMLKGAMEGGLGVQAASLPRHISLGMPYEVPDWEKYEEFASDLSKKLKPVSVTLCDMGCGKLGERAGSWFLKFCEDFGLDEIREETKKELFDSLKILPIEKDNVKGQKNITLGFGKASYESYETYVNSFDKSLFIGHECKFTELGIFYYDEPTISASTFFCAQRFKLN